MYPIRVQSGKVSSFKIIYLVGNPFSWVRWCAMKMGQSCRVGKITPHFICTAGSSLFTLSTKSSNLFSMPLMLKPRPIAPKCTCCIVSYQEATRVIPVKNIFKLSFRTAIFGDNAISHMKCMHQYLLHVYVHIY